MRAAFFATLEVAPEAGAGRASAVATLLAEIRTRLEVPRRGRPRYLTLDRQARTLSGGEAQRVHLTTALGTSLVNALYVLDEPSVGLHPRDNARLVRILRRLRDQGNTVVVVEHDPAIVCGRRPPGRHGAGRRRARRARGRRGDAREVAADPASVTGAWLSGRRRVPRPARRRDLARRPARRRPRRASEQPDRRRPARAPLGGLTVLAGVSGSGKSTLAHDVLYLALRARDRAARGDAGRPRRGGRRRRPSPTSSSWTSRALGRTPRANPATYVGAWDGIRARFARTPEARERVLHRVHVLVQRPRRAMRAVQGRRAREESRCSSSPTSTSPARTATAGASVPRCCEVRVEGARDPRGAAPDRGRGARRASPSIRE